MIPYLNKILGGLLVLSLLGLTVQSIRLDRAQDYHKEYVAELKDKLVEAYKKNNEERIRAEQAEALADKKYLEGKRDAKKLHDAIAADLRTDNERLQKHWREALRRLNQTTTSTADSGGDGQADAVSTDLALFVQRAAEADARIVRLQDRIDNYLKQVNGVGWYGREVGVQQSGGSRDIERLVAESFGARGKTEENSYSSNRP